MKSQKYEVNQHLVSTILAWVKAGEIAIPEIQRPFVWDSSKVRDLMDSLYHGYPVGYLIAWQNPDVRLKDGSSSGGRKILIDGQQRVTALTAALLGEQVVNRDYRRVRIKIAFEPLTQRFEVSNPAILKDKAWIQDIAGFVDRQVNLFDAVDAFCEQNVEADRRVVQSSFQQLVDLSNRQIGLIQLDGDLDIETVTEIFIRINSKGVVLSQADFAMSKIAADQKYGGAELRKAIDYFCHLAVAPEAHDAIVENDADFARSAWYPRLAWLKNEKDDLYDPDYSDLLRVAFTSKFGRGKLSDLVALLSGRNFETRQYVDEIAGASFAKLTGGVQGAMNETRFKRFLMIVRSGGFIRTGLIRSQNVLNFAYILYLMLSERKDYQPHQIESFVRRWIAMSLLTGRYSGSSETQFDYDVRQIENRAFHEYLESLESADLSDAFWTVGLVQELDTGVMTSRFMGLYWASQVKAADKGFLSRDITVQDLLEHRGDVHHLFPRDYLKKKGLKRGQYNQIANLVYMQQEINIRIGNTPPAEYFETVRAQVRGGTRTLGGIVDAEELARNFSMHCIPTDVSDLTVSGYQDFLAKRRVLMAQKLRSYYESL